MCFEREGSMGMGTAVKLGTEVVCQNTCSNWKAPVQGLCPDQMLVQILETCINLLVLPTNFWFLS